MRFAGYFNDTAQDIIGVMNQAREIAVQAQAMGMPGYTEEAGLNFQTAMPTTASPGIAPALPPVHSSGAAMVPVMPVLLGGAAGYFYKRSVLWGAIGAAAGFILGNMFGNVVVAGQATAVPIPPPQLVQGASYEA